MLWADAPGGWVTIQSAKADLYVAFYRVTHEAPHVSLDNYTATSEGDGNRSPQFRHLCPVSSHLEAPSKVTLENPLSFLLSTRRTLGEEPEEREKMELMVAVLPVWKWCWGSTGS